MTRIYLKKNEDFRIRHGHLWVFSNEIGRIEGDPQNGDIVELYDSRDNFLGCGFFNKNSLISFRLLSSKFTDDFSSLFKERLLAAFHLRKSLYPTRESFRLIFSESDYLPGLIIDKYNNIFVLQVYSIGMEKNIESIIQLLKTDYNAENIFSKNEFYFRKLEGLTEEDKVYFGEHKQEIIDDGLIRYHINFKKGHKTGFYFDQSDNRFFIERLVKGKRVVDAFCNSGGFGLHAANGGAESVNFVDSSSSEIENARMNYELNKFTTPAEFISKDVFEYFDSCIAEKKYFDVVMIDPPAFAKNKKSLPAAKKGYEKLNKSALTLIKDEGFLVTSSCSFHLKKDEFVEIINSAAVKANKFVQLIHFNTASLDHPSLPGMEETSYLKFAVLKVNTL